MDSDNNSPIDREEAPPGVDEFLPAEVRENRRTRLAGSKKDKNVAPLPPRVHDWLIRTTRIHAHLCHVVRCFGRPAGDDPGDTLEARAARRDRTLLYDCWAYAIGELLQLQAEVSTEMEPGAATSHTPGSPEKIEIMRQRAERLESIFAEGDPRFIHHPRAK